MAGRWSRKSGFLQVTFVLQKCGMVSLKAFNNFGDVVNNSLVLILSAALSLYKAMSDKITKQFYSCCNCDINACQHHGRGIQIIFG